MAFSILKSVNVLRLMKIIPTFATGCGNIKSPGPRRITPLTSMILTKDGYQKQISVMQTHTTKRSEIPTPKVSEARRSFVRQKREKVRILILGDSFTCGDEASDNETYSEPSPRNATQNRSDQHGVHGYGHDQMLILFKEEGVKYQPDVVILGFLPLDMSRNLLDFRDFAKPRFRPRNRAQVRAVGILVSA